MREYGVIESTDSKRRVLSSDSECHHHEEGRLDLFSTGEGKAFLLDDRLYEIPIAGPLAGVLGHFLRVGDVFVVRHQAVSILVIQVDSILEATYTEFIAEVLERIVVLLGAKILVTISIDLCEAAHDVGLLRVPLDALLFGTFTIFQHDGEENDWDEDGQKDCNHDDCNDGRLGKAALVSFLALFSVDVLSVSGGTSGADIFLILVRLVFNVCH